MNKTQQQQQQPQSLSFYLNEKHISAFIVYNEKKIEFVFAYLISSSVIKRIKRNFIHPSLCMNGRTTPNQSRH